MAEIEEILNYNFKNEQLIKEALTHPSCSYTNSDERNINYERLEFLGDSVLSLIMAEELIKKFPLEKEGSLAKRQSSLVRGETITKIAQKIALGEYMIISASEESCGGRNNASNLENTLEAIIGAIYLDGGIEAANKFICDNWIDFLECTQEPPKDSKTILQEWSQSNNMPIPEYIVEETVGPAHNPQFTISVNILNHDKVIASGDSKKKAQQEAARNFIQTNNIEL